MLAFGLKLILQLAFQTMFLFMILWMTLIDNRWENLRYFLIQNYSTEKADIYLSGSLILFFFIVTILGRGFESFIFKHKE